MYLCGMAISTGSIVMPLQWHLTKTASIAASIVNQLESDSALPDDTPVNQEMGLYEDESDWPLVWFRFPLGLHLQWAPLR